MRSCGAFCRSRTDRLNRVGRKLKGGKTGPPHLYRVRVVSVDRVTLIPVSVVMVKPCNVCGKRHRHSWGAGMRRAHCTSPANVAPYCLAMPFGVELARQIAKARRVDAPETRESDYANKFAAKYGVPGI